jgi:two-component system sensor histidine kinase VanS
MLLLLLMSFATVLLFARQFITFYREEQQRQFNAAFEPILVAIGGKDMGPEEIKMAAQVFADRNQSFEFMIEEEDGKVLFSTMTMRTIDIPEAVFDVYAIEPQNNVAWTMYGSPPAGDTESFSDASDMEVAYDKSGNFVIRRSYVTTEWPEAFYDNDRVPSFAPAIGTSVLADAPGVRYIFTGQIGTGTGPISYGDLIQRSLLALVLMLAIAVFGAILFAKKVTKPLEDEIVRERAMEENQRLFFSAASHELKTPIAAARALVEGMIAGVGDYKDHPKYLRECLKTLDSQTHLVSETLEIVKLSDKDTVPAMDPLDLRELGNAVLTEYLPLADQRGIVVQGVFPHVKVKADRNLLQRVLSNIMANAIQNTPECGIIKIESEKQASLRLSIHNTGAHIPDEELPRLFEPFFRLDTARTRHGSRTGLGLTIVKKALDRMAVPFSLENTAEGVRFSMELQI